MKKPKTLEELRAQAQAKANESGREVTIYMNGGEPTGQVRFGSNYTMGEVITPEWDKVKW